MLFTETVNCSDYIALVVDGWDGAMVEWYWQGKTAVLWEKPVTVSLCPPQIPHGQAWDRTNTYTVTGWQWTAWAMAWPITMWSGRGSTSHDHNLTQTSGTEIQQYTILLHYVRKTNQWMIYMEIMVILCKNHIECLNTLCGENAELLTWHSISSHMTLINISVVRTWNLTRSNGKAVPLQTWSGPEGSRKLRFSDFMTTAQGGGKFVSLTHRPHLPPGNSPGTHFC